MHTYTHAHIQIYACAYTHTCVVGEHVHGRSIGYSLCMACSVGFLCANCMVDRLGLFVHCMIGRLGFLVHCMVGRLGFVCAWHGRSIGFPLCIAWSVGCVFFVHCMVGRLGLFCTCQAKKFRFMADEAERVFDSDLADKQRKETEKLIEAGLMPNFPTYKEEKEYNPALGQNLAHIINPSVPSPSFFGQGMPSPGTAGIGFGGGGVGGKVGSVGSGTSAFGQDNRPGSMGMSPSAGGSMGMPIAGGNIGMGLKSNLPGPPGTGGAGMGAGSSYRAVPQPTHFGDAAERMPWDE